MILSLIAKPWPFACIVYIESYFFPVDVLMVPADTEIPPVWEICWDSIQVQQTSPPPEKCIDIISQIECSVSFIIHGEQLLRPSPFRITYPLSYYPVYLPRGDQILITFSFYAHEVVIRRWDIWDPVYVASS